MKLPKKTVHPFPKKENFQIVPEDTVTFFKSERDRLFAAERKSRAVEEMVGLPVTEDGARLMEGDNPGAIRPNRHTKPADKRPD